MEEKEIDKFRLNLFWEDNNSDLSSNMRLDDFGRVMQYKFQLFDPIHRSYDYDMDNYSAKDLDTLNKHAFKFDYDLFEA